MHARYPRLSPALPFAFAALLAACGDDGGNSDPAADAGADTDNDAADAPNDLGGDPDTADVPIEVPPVPEGTALVFDLAVAADASDPATFFDFPFPSDLRMDDDGTLSVAGLPNPSNQAIVANLVAGADEYAGNSMLPVAWFRFDGPVADSELEDVITASAEAPALLINIDPDSPRRGELAPVVADALEADRYTAENVLAVGVYPGWVLDHDTTYAFVVRRDWGDVDGGALGVPEPLWNMAHGGSSGDAAADASYAPLWPVLDEIGVGRSDVAAATVFTTGDPVGDVWEMSEGIRERYDLQIEDLVIDPDDGDTHERFCELHGTMEVPEFQQGTPPFNSGGTFVLGGDGLPVEQGRTAIPVVIALPLEEMPDEGFPLVMYFHGSGGVSTQVVDRGPDWQPKLGPSHVLALHGIASVGSAHPVNPERLAQLGQGSSGFDYLNLSNLTAFRDTFRQGIFEQRLFLDALLDLEITPETVAGCEGLSLPDGATGYRFDGSPVMAMGQSMGGMFANIMAPVEPRIEAVVPTGAGGFWSYFILETTLIPGVSGLLTTVLQTDQLSHVHPALHMLQLAWEPVEAFVYVPRLAWDPIDGHPVRSIYQPVGEDDSYFPELIFDRIALAYRNQQAGQVVWPGLQASLAQRNLDGLADYPTSQNRTAADGTEYTGVVVQWANDGVHDGHEVFQHFEEVQHQYGCFLETYYRTGVGVVSAPAPAGSPCAGLE